MQITVNGQNRDFQAPLTIAGLLESLGFSSKAVVVERNLKIIDRTVFDKESLEEGDRIEIIRLVGGG
ncbi:MAG: sulfur carrier protein ThiS [Syntrophobacteraceae bacterium]